jgi:glycosyltransferase involved in cell wall biosynthesis
VTPLVSILIPAFNAAASVGQAVDSALAQTWSRKEVVVVDDGSSDGTAGVVQDRIDGAPCSLRLLRQQNSGQSAALNRAFAEARGDLIQYLDADDLLAPDKIERQVQRIAGDPACIASGEWARFYREPHEARFVPERVWRDLDPVTWLIEAFTGGEPMMQPGIWLLPRAVVERAGPWDERLSLINDFEYFTRVLLAASEVRFTPGARLFYRSGNPNSVASLRSVAAFRSALLSMELGTAALLERSGSAAARVACADVFQVLAFDAYLRDDQVARAAEQHADRLGGSQLRLGGGRLVRTVEQFAGWKRAKRVKSWAYYLGYGRIARTKASVSRSLKAEVA